MQVRELLDDPALRLQLRVPGQPDRPIRWVHSIEVADPGRFLRGGEVVLTAGVWRAGGTAATDYVERVAAAGAAAVGYGLVPGMPGVPEGFVDAAGRHGLTCFVVPVEVPFVQIVERFVAAKRAEWERPLRSHLDGYDAIVAALRNERGVAPVLRILSRQLGLPVALRTAARDFGVPPAPVHAVPLVGDGLADAELLLPVPRGELDTEQQAALAQAMPFLALELERVRAVRDAERRFAAELFDWLRAGSAEPGAVAARVRSLGLDPTEQLAGFVARGPHPEQLAAALGEQGVCAPYEGGVTGLVAPGGDLDDCARRLLAAAGGEVALGLGQPAGPDGLRTSLVQAGHAAAALERRGRSGYLTHEGLASPALLLLGRDRELLSTTSRALLGPVLEYDRRRDGELLASLRAFLDAGGRWQQAATRLHLHVNTLRHRIARVEELTGRDVMSTPDRVDLYLALRALEA